VPNTIRQWLDFALQQVAAESYLQGIDLSDTPAVRQQLLDGNNNRGRVPSSSFKGFTRMTGPDENVASQVRVFSARFKIVSHQENDRSGFSATLLQRIADENSNPILNGEYTLSFRSTEYRVESQGGDITRDLAADKEILNFGFAFGQLRGMEQYWNRLVAGKTASGADDPRLAEFKAFIAGAGNQINVTGYSLGGHLATVFTELHDDKVKAAYAFNALGRGQINATGYASDAQAIRAILDAFEARLTQGGAVAQQGADSLYSSSNYSAAVSMAVSQFGLGPIPSSPGIERATGPLAKVRSLYGHATHGDSESAANLGVHGPSTSIFIEDQPDVEGAFGTLPVLTRITQYLNGDFGNTHALVLLVDSLSVMDLFAILDPALSQRQIESILASSSSARAEGLILTSGTAEHDSLEKALDSLYQLFVNPDATESPAGRKGSQFGDITNRTAFQNRVAELRGAVHAQAGTFKVINLVPESRYAANGEPLTNTHADYAGGFLADIQAKAVQTDATGVAYRYALKSGNPYVVLATDGNSGSSAIDEARTRAVYATLHNTNGELELFNTATRMGSLTTAYIGDRAEFLTRKLFYNVNDLDPRNPGHAPAEDPYKVYADLGSSYQIGNPGLASRRYVFGDDHPNVIQGGTLTIGDQKWLRKSEQRYKWKLRALCWAEDGLAQRSV